MKQIRVIGGPMDGQYQNDRGQTLIAPNGVPVAARGTTEYRQRRIVARAADGSMHYSEVVWAPAYASDSEVWAGIRRLGFPEVV